MMNSFCASIFFFNEAPTTKIYTLSLHDALPISPASGAIRGRRRPRPPNAADPRSAPGARSEEHTSELQSRPHLVCRLLLEKKKKKERNQISKKTTKTKTSD